MFYYLSNFPNCFDNLARSFRRDIQETISFFVLSSIYVCLFLRWFISRIILDRFFHDTGGIFASSIYINRN